MTDVVTRITVCTVMPLEKAVELPVYKVYDMAQIFRALFELDSIYVYNQFLAVRVVLNPLFVAVVEPLQVIEPYRRFILQDWESRI